MGVRCNSYKYGYYLPYLNPRSPILDDRIFHKIVWNKDDKKTIMNSSFKYACDHFDELCKLMDYEETNFC